ncbi:hypothetical protein KOR42_08120 [Thalassoglobus neptunius]|uniref:DUF1573 domain-containing protein n=1 Tax=Thalassoglobus neptunius TaxID=1938619 RepID=A0A5C5X546_9PLAN|nr:hypothetical protein [Thalassoglobus neptunius]TWT57451.1 hypothetical protein KOR42_08120 [Thalassoglobus neptunius]
MSHLHLTLLSVISTFILVAGCSGQSAKPENAGVEFSAPTQLPALLLSELQGDTPRTIRCPVRIHNNSDRNQQVVLTGTGCSCYGVVTDNDEPFETGTEREVGSGQKLTLAIQGQSPQEESRKTYTADFEITAEDGTRSVQRILCTQQVYQDFKAVPALIECEMSRNSPQFENRELEITRYFRSDSPTTPTPVLDGVPDDVRVKSIRMVDSPIEVETGLWHATWKIDLEIERQDLTGSADRIDTLNVRLPSSEEAAAPETASDPVAAHAAIRLVRRSSRPIAYPERIHFGQFQVGTPKTRSLFLVSKEQIPFRVSYAAPDEETSIEVQFEDEAKTSHKLTVTLNSVPAGEFSRTLKLNTNLEEQSVIEIELLARILPPLDD